MASPSTDIQREMIALLDRIVGDQPLPSDLQRKVIEILASLTPPVGTDGLASRNVASLAAGVRSTLGATAATAAGNRRLIYVHGICRHDHGFSDDWWNALHPFERTAFGDGRLGETRLEVVWSDIVNLAAASMQATAMTAGLTTGAVSPAISAETAQQRAADEIKEALRDRADQHVLAMSMAAGSLAATPTAVSEVGGLISIPGLNCIDDFSVYLIDDDTRQRIIDRFLDVVGPQLRSGRELDIIAHSWGTVVAYEGLRQLDAEAQIGRQIRNFFTVGAALSIAPVKLRLRSANRDGKKPKAVRRWVNLDAHGDIIGGPLKGRPYAVDFDFLNLSPVGCNSLFGLVETRVRPQLLFR